MPTLYVENVPKELYELLRDRARSIAAETLSLLERTLPTAAELRRRAAFYRRVQRFQAQPAVTKSQSSTEELLRRDRRR
jgi:hypothetical protein